MNIGKGDFKALVAVLQQSMDAKGIPFSAQNDMLARPAPLHREVLTQDRRCPKASGMHPESHACRMAWGNLDQEDGMVHVMAHVEARPEAVDAVRRLFDALLAPTRAEPGCVDYQVFEDSTQPGRFVTVECWADRAAFDDHMASAHVATAFAAADGLLAQPPHIAPYRRG